MNNMWNKKFQDNFYIAQNDFGKLWSGSEIKYINSVHHELQWNIALLFTSFCVTSCCLWELIGLDQEPK